MDTTTPGTFQGLSNFFAPSRAARGLSLSLTSIAILAIALFLLHISPSTAHAQSLIWDASGANPAAPTDGFGTWGSGANWSNGSVDSGWVSGDNASIGANGGLTTPANPQYTTTSPPPYPATAGLIVMGTGGNTIGNLTFNAFSGASSFDYIVEDNSIGGANPLVLNNVNSNVSNPTTTITSNTAANVTSLAVNLEAPTPFTLNALGTGNIGFGGSVGVGSTGTEQRGWGAQCRNQLAVAPPTLAS